MAPSGSTYRERLERLTHAVRQSQFVAPMPSASEAMAMAVTKGVLKSVRMANLKLRIKALDGPRDCGVYSDDGSADTAKPCKNPDRYGVRLANKP